MAIVSIPVDSALPSYSLEVELSGVDYQIDMDWNSRAGHWLFSLSVFGGDPIVTGVVLAPGAMLLSRTVGEDRPPGDVFVTGTGSVVGREDLGNGQTVSDSSGIGTGTVAQLLYVTDDDENQDLTFLYDTLFINK